MMGRPTGGQGKLFYVGLNLEDRVPEDHPLRRISRAIDFGFVRGRVAHLYGVNGNESVDPALILRLMFLAFFERVVSERELMRQLRLRLDWLWFCGLDLDSPVPDHSVLSKARRRWGLEVFEEVFAHVLRACVEAGLVGGETLYADSTVLKADASVDSRVPRGLWNQLERGLGPQGKGGGENSDGDDDDDRGSAGEPARTPPPPQDTQAAALPPPPAGRFNAAIVSTTDPDAATTRRRGRGVTLGYRDHCLVDDRRGIVVATIAAPADYDDGAMLVPLLDSSRGVLGADPLEAVGDSAYGTRENVGALRERGIDPYLKPRPAKGDTRSWLERMAAGCDPRRTLELMRRRLHVAEGRFAQAHTRHEHRRCRWRRRWRVQIQCYLVAAAQNLKKLAKALARNPRGAAQAAGASRGSAGHIAPPRRSPLQSLLPAPA